MDITGSRKKEWGLTAAIYASFIVSVAVNSMLEKENAQIILSNLVLSVVLAIVFSVYLHMARERISGMRPYRLMPEVFYVAAFFAALLLLGIGERFPVGVFWLLPVVLAAMGSGMELAFATHIVLMVEYLILVMPQGQQQIYSFISYLLLGTVASLLFTALKEKKALVYLAVILFACDMVLLFVIYQFDLAAMMENILFAGAELVSIALLVGVGAILLWRQPLSDGENGEEVSAEEALSKLLQVSEKLASRESGQPVSLNEEEAKWGERMVVVEVVNDQEGQAGAAKAEKEGHSSAGEEEGREWIEREAAVPGGAGALPEEGQEEEPEPAQVVNLFDTGTELKEEAEGISEADLAEIEAELLEKEEAGAESQEEEPEPAQIIHLFHTEEEAEEPEPGELLHQLGNLAGMEAGREEGISDQRFLEEVAEAGKEEDGMPEGGLPEEGLSEAEAEAGWEESVFETGSPEEKPEAAQKEDGLSEEDLLEHMGEPGAVQEEDGLSEEDLLEHMGEPEAVQEEDGLSEEDLLEHMGEPEAVPEEDGLSEDGLLEHMGEPEAVPEEDGLSEAGIPEYMSELEAEINQEEDGLSEAGLLKHMGEPETAQEEDVLESGLSESEEELEAVQEGDSLLEAGLTEHVGEEELEAAPEGDSVSESGLSESEEELEAVQEGDSVSESGLPEEEPEAVPEEDSLAGAGLTEYVGEEELEAAQEGDSVSEAGLPEEEPEVAQEEDSLSGAGLPESLDESESEAAQKEEEVLESGLSESEEELETTQEEEGVLESGLSEEEPEAAEEAGSVSEPVSPEPAAEPESSLAEILEKDFPLYELLEEYSAELFQHSSRISALSAAAAAVIGADVELARAGGLYHEIGRIMNEGNYVEEGMELAREYGFPQELVDVIGQHSIAAQMPESAEAAIVMLSDCIITTGELLEKNGKRGTVTDSKLVNRVFKSRIAAGNLKDSGLTAEQLIALKDYYTDNAFTES